MHYFKITLLMFQEGIVMKEKFHHLCLKTKSQQIGKINFLLSLTFWISYQRSQINVSEYFNLFTFKKQDKMKHNKNNKKRILHKSSSKKNIHKCTHQININATLLLKFQFIPLYCRRKKYFHQLLYLKTYCFYY